MYERAQDVRRARRQGGSSDLSYESQYHYERIATLEATIVDALRAECAPSHVWRWVAYGSRPMERALRCALMVTIRRRVDLGDRWPIDKEKTAALAAYLEKRAAAMTTTRDAAAVIRAGREPWKLIPMPEDLDASIYEQAMSAARARPPSRRVRRPGERPAAPLLTPRERRVLDEAARVIARLRGSEPA